jgi:hypothetical protein
MLFTGGLNDILKLAFHGPRPYWYSTQVKALSSETSFGVPSGHSQTAAGLWGMLAAEMKRPWAWGVAVFLIFMIGLSRLYLGVHFVHDVLAGWALGVLVLWIFLRWWDGLAEWANQKSFGQQVGLAFAFSLIMVILGVLAFGNLRGWTLPATWVENAKLTGAEKLPEPVTLNNTITSAAVLFGMLAGLAWLNLQGGFRVQGSLAHKAARFIVGFLGVLVLYLGLKMIFPSGDTVIAYVLRYLRYTLLGLWIFAGAPWLFLKLKLAQKAK